MSPSCASACTASKSAATSIERQAARMGARARPGLCARGCAVAAARGAPRAPSCAAEHGRHCHGMPERRARPGRARAAARARPGPHPAQQAEALHERLAHEAPVRAVVHGGHVQLLALHRGAQALLPLGRAQAAQLQRERAAQRQAAGLPHTARRGSFHLYQHSGAKGRHASRLRAQPHCMSVWPAAALQERGRPMAGCEHPGFTGTPQAARLHTPSTLWAGGQAGQARSAASKHARRPRAGTRAATHARPERLPPTESTPAASGRPGRTQQGRPAAGGRPSSRSAAATARPPAEPGSGSGFPGAGSASSATCSSRTRARRRPTTRL